MNEAGNKSSREQSGQRQGGLAPLSLLDFWEVFQGAWPLFPEESSYLCSVTDYLQPICAYLMGWRLEGQLWAHQGVQVCFLWILNVSGKRPSLPLQGKAESPGFSQNCPVFDGGGPRHHWPFCHGPHPDILLGFPNGCSFFFIFFPEKKKVCLTVLIWGSTLRELSVS